MITCGACGTENDFARAIYCIECGANLIITVNDNEIQEIKDKDLESVMFHIEEIMGLAKGKQRRDMDISRLDEEKVESIKKIVQILPSKSVKDIQFNSWLDLGRLARRLDMTKEAEFLYRTALKNRPDHVRAWNSLGNLLMSENRYNEADEAYRTALKFNPAYFISIRNLARLLRKSLRFDESVEMYGLALKFKPEDVSSWHSLGNVYHYLENWKESVVCWENAIKYGSDDSNLKILIEENKKKI
jgi:tetratricopeptide (TPR) repeat protein